MSTTVATRISARPKRRLFQFSLRNMLALTTVVCIWLGYNARGYQAEQAVVELARQLDPKVETKWNSPSWWRNIFGDKPAGIFGRLHYLGLQGPRLTIEKLSDLPLDRLTSLQTLALVDTEIWDEDAEAWHSDLGLHFEIQWLDIDSIVNQPSLYRVFRENFQHANADKKGRLRRAILNKGHIGASFHSEPGELRPIGSCGYRLLDGDEEYLDLLLGANDEEMAVLAARTLWKLKSRLYTERVVEFAEKLQPSNPHARLVKRYVLDAVRPEAILKELKSEKVEWGSWLAALYPDPSLVPALIAAVDDNRATNETIYALGQANDPRAVPVLFKLLSGYGLASGALMQYADKSLETQLIAGLKDGNEWFVRNATWILSWMGSSRALPELRRLDDEWRLRPDTLLYGTNIVSEAIANIEAQKCESPQADAAQGVPDEEP